MRPACQNSTVDATLRPGLDPASSRRYSPKILVLPSESHLYSMPGWRNHVVLSGLNSVAAAVPSVSMCCLPQPPYRNRPVGLCMMVAPAPPHAHSKLGRELAIEELDMHGVPPTTKPVNCVPGSVLWP